MSREQRHVVLSAAFLLVVSSMLQAAVPAPQRTFVSAVSGNDSNSCLRLAPCRNFAAAILATASGGEVIVLDSGGYGPVTINQSVSLISPSGVFAGITAFTGSAINITPGTSGNVVLRGLFLNSQGGSIGIVFASGQVLHVENCVINGFPLKGIEVVRSDAAAIELSVTDTTIRNGALNSPESSGGIHLSSSAGSITGLIDGCKVDRYYAGILSQNGTQLVVRNSTLTHNTLGVVVQPITAGDFGENVLIDNCVVAFNNDGILAGLSTSAFPIVLIRGSSIFKNARYGLWMQAGGNFEISTSLVGRNPETNHMETDSTCWTWGNNIALLNGCIPLTPQ